MTGSWEIPPASEWGHSTARPEGAKGLLAYIEPLLVYWWLLGPLTVMGGLAGFAYYYYLTPVYQARCRFEIFENQMLRLDNRSAMRDNSYYYFSTNPIERHILLMTSKDLDWRIRRRLAADWGHGKRLSSPVSLTVQPVEKAPREMVDIMVNSADANYSVAYLKMLLEEYRSLRRDENKQLHNNTVQNLRAEQARLDENLKQARKAVMEFEAEHNIRFEEKRSESEQEYMREILRKGRAIRTQRTMLESQLKALGKKANAPTLRDAMDLTVYSTAREDRTANAGEKAPTWDEMPAWQAKEALLIRLQAEYDEMRKIYKVGHPKLDAMRKKIDQARREQEISSETALKRLQARLQALKLQENAMEKAAASIQSGLRLTAADWAKYENLKARAEHFKSLYDRVFTRIIDATSVPKDRYFSRVVEKPQANPVPVWPVRWRLVMLGIIFSAGIGVVLVFLLYHHRMRLYNLDLLERELGLMPIGTIPKVLRLAMQNNPKILNTLHKADPVCEAYRSVRTALEEMLGDSGRVVLLTSPEQGEGKSFTTVNTAIASSWSKKRVLLIDGDFRRATLSRLFSISSGQSGLSDCLADPSADWQKSVVEVAPNLDLFPAGTSGEHAAELLKTGPVNRIFEEIRARYDLVMIDSAPVNHVVDTVLLSKLSELAVLVITPGTTSIPSVRHAVRRLSSENLIGYIANNVTPSTQRYYSDYSLQNYGYGYGYGEPRNRE